MNGSLSCSYLDGVKTEEIVTPKTVNSYRKIPFMGEAEEMLLAQKKKVEALKKSLGKRWRASEELGDLVFVSTMGSAATRCFEVGMEPKVVQSLMGHSNISTTLNIYTHVLEEKRMQEVAKFGNAIKHLIYPNKM